MGETQAKYLDFEGNVKQEVMDLRKCIGADSLAARQTFVKVVKTVFSFEVTLI
jgi:hypothetical protein